MIQLETSSGCIQLRLGSYLCADYSSVLLQAQAEGEGEEWLAFVELRIDDNGNLEIRRVLDWNDSPALARALPSDSSAARYPQVEIT